MRTLSSRQLLILVYLTNFVHMLEAASPIANKLLLRVAVSNRNYVNYKRYFSAMRLLCNILRANCTVRDYHDDITAPLDAVAKGEADIALPWYVILDERLPRLQFTHPLYKYQPLVLISKSKSRYCFHPLKILGPITLLVVALTACLLTLADYAWAPLVMQVCYKTDRAAKRSVERQRLLNRFVRMCLFGLVSIGFNADARSLLSLRCPEPQYEDASAIITAIEKGELTHLINANNYNHLEFALKAHLQLADLRKRLHTAYQQMPPQYVGSYDEMVRAFKANSESPKRAFGKGRLFHLMQGDAVKHVMKNNPAILKYASVGGPFLRSFEWCSFPVSKNVSAELFNRMNRAVLRMIESGIHRKYDRLLEAMKLDERCCFKIQRSNSDWPTPILLDQLLLVFWTAFGAMVACTTAFLTEILIAVALKRCQMEMTHL